MAREVISHRGVGSCILFHMDSNCSFVSFPKSVGTVSDQQAAKLPACARLKWNCDKIILLHTSVKRKICMTALFQRLEQLRVVTGKTWDQIATDLARTSFHAISRQGRHEKKLSSKVMYRLAQAELAAGITNNPGAISQKGAPDKGQIAGLPDEKLTPESSGHCSQISIEVIKTSGWSIGEELHRLVVLRDSG